MAITLPVRPSGRWSLATFVESAADAEASLNVTALEQDLTAALALKDCDIFSNLDTIQPGYIATPFSWRLAACHLL